MNIEFIQAKNGELTAKYNSLFLHSAYSPISEAKRFIDNLNIPFEPKVFIFCEPAINYIFPILKEKFPNSKYGIIRYSNSFDNYNYDSDFVIYYSKNVSLENDLFNNLNEEELCSSYFIPWQPCSKAFSDIDSKVWEIIKKNLEKSKTLLITREYFEKKWFINSCKFIKNIQNIFSINKTTLPIAIIASGPSLNSKLSFLKANQNNFFIISLSSSISALLENNIRPDLCFSTDGGYWAGEHLKKLKKNNIPLALSIEGFCPTQILQNNKIIPLSYSDGLSCKILQKSKISSYLAVRNGTVSGTALDFALNYFDTDIYFFGLDLAVGKEFQHTQPNENEINNLYKDNKISSLEKRIALSSFGSDSLKIYEEWFKNKKINNRNVFRIIENDEKQNSFNFIKDINITVLSKQIKKSNIIKKTETFFTKEAINKENISDYVFELIKDIEILKNLFPLDFVSLSHKNGDEHLIKERIEAKKNKLVNQLRKIYNAD